AGLVAVGSRLRYTDRANFGGTFTFGADFERDASGNVILDANSQPINITSIEHYRRTLLGLLGYRPSQVSIVRGNPFTRLSQWEMAWFAQDDWRVFPRLSLSYGLRHNFQPHLGAKL